MIFGAIPPPRNFAKIHARGGRGLQPEQPKNSIPPWGQRGTRRRGAAAVPEPGGRGGKTAVCRGGPGVDGLLPGRRGAGAMPGGAAGVFGAKSRGVPSGRRAANGAQAGLGRVSPTKAACRARRRGAGTFPGGGARAVYGGFPGRTRGRRGVEWWYTAGGPGIAGAAGLSPGRGGRRRRTGEKRSDLRGLCRVTGHRWEGRQRRGRKGPFSLYKEALFMGRGLCRFRADLPPKPCRFGRVAFSAARSDECVTPGGAGEKPRRKTKRDTERKERTP